ncbi:hypothetical protein PL263_05085 [Methylomonas sp. EFPC3]|uniref:hypothetical protein n=1 Tax=Methylomonas sp. EFPC3 TaxID=3021710 RepID=UPI002415CBE4|nr:hypothetical protein [Methylomonas sp. EFPC3]WFP51404.1 hypothetical protein PL263_05085 [Methylomonas sp. EFPC3]
MANQELLLFALNEFGNAISHDQLYIELSWLEQTANTIVVRVTGGIYVAQLNDSGLDVAKGNRFIPGIRRPIPSEIP